MPPDRLPRHSDSRSPANFPKPGLKAVLGLAMLALAVLLVALFAIHRPGQAADLPLHQIRLPSGFHIELLTDQVPNARAMTLGRFRDGSGTLFVGSRGEGKVYAVELADNRATRVRTVASRLDLPVGVAWRDGDLYVSAVSRILRLPGIDDRLDAPPKPEVVTDRFPKETHHGWKFIGFGPDGYLYVPVGAPCNVCERDENRYANIMKMRPDGSDLRVVARGVRNTVGFDWHPVTRELWFTDNGRDWMGDDAPDCELNRLSQPGEHFGFPYCHQGDLGDPEFGHRHSCSEFTAPVAKLGPHVAPLGMRFYTGSMFPAEYRHNIFIAEHGSWNRSERIGYRIKRVVIDDQGRLVHQEVFAHGWLQPDGKAWGRPADVLVMPDGALLVSDDQAGAIYRISYRGPSR